MAITVSNNALITVSGLDLTDHCVQLTLNDGQESREITHLRSSVKNYPEPIPGRYGSCGNHTAG